MKVGNSFTRHSCQVFGVILILPGSPSNSRDPEPRCQARPAAAKGRDKKPDLPGSSLPELFHKTDLIPVANSVPRSSRGRRGSPRDDVGSPEGEKSAGRREKSTGTFPGHPPAPRSYSLPQLLAVVRQLLSTEGQTVGAPDVPPAGQRGGDERGLPSQPARLPPARPQRPHRPRTHQLMCRAPPWRSCRSCTNRRSAFLSSSTLALCTTTTAAGRGTPGRPRGDRKGARRPPPRRSPPATYA